MSKNPRIVIFTDADNTLWDTDAVYARGQLTVLEDVETAIGVRVPSKNRLEFVREYVEHVPYYLSAGYAAAQQLGISNQMQQMGSELETYWFEANDVIPDHLGLMGVMYDAYASLLLLQSVSDYCQATSGHPLLPQNLTQANQAIRNMIGEPGASHIDGRVGITIAQAMMQNIMGQIAANPAFAFGGGPDPYWGDASVDEIVNTRLGAMGVI